MNVGLEHYLIVSALLFALGLLGVITRRNLIVMYMSLELMLNSANLALVSFSRFNDNLNGQVMVFFIITVAAAEVAVGLALIVALEAWQAAAAGGRAQFYRAWPAPVRGVVYALLAFILFMGLSNAPSQFIYFQF